MNTGLVDYDAASFPTFAELLALPRSADELAAGHWERLKHLKRLTEVPPLDDTTRTQRLEYIAKHSTFGFQHCLDRSYSSGFDGLPPGRVLYFRPQKLPSRYPHFCVQCCADDVRDQGFSHWRRTHQLTGFDACLRHGIPLTRLSGHHALSVQPTGMSPSSVERAAHRQFEGEQQAPAVRTYEQVALCIASCERAMSHRRFLSEISKAASEAGIRTSFADRQTKGTYLSDVALDKFPHSWLMRHFPRLRQKVAGRPSGLIDLMLLKGQPVGGHYVALALAALFPSLQDCLALLGRR